MTGAATYSGGVRPPHYVHCGRRNARAAMYIAADAARKWKERKKEFGNVDCVTCIALRGLRYVDCVAYLLERKKNC